FGCLGLAVYGCMGVWVCPNRRPEHEHHQEHDPKRPTPDRGSSPPPSALRGVTPAPTHPHTHTPTHPHTQAAYWIGKFTTARSCSGRKRVGSSSTCTTTGKAAFMFGASFFRTSPAVLC